MTIATINDDDTVSVPAMKMTANDIDQLIRELAEIREAMQPAVPRKFEIDIAMRIQEDADMVVAEAKKGTIGLMLRHSGHGWLVFTFSRRNAAALVGHIQERIERGPIAELADEELTGGGGVVH